MSTAGCGRWTHSDQDRSFTYDHAGFLLEEIHPEIQGKLVYSGYLPLGNFREKKHLYPGSSVYRHLEYDYDQLGRLVSVKEDLGGGNLRPWKSFTYADRNLAQNWLTASSTTNAKSKGKLFSATRHNWVRADPAQPPGPASEVDLVVTETYAYEGIGGRVSSRRTRVDTGQVFEQAYTYDTLGNPTEVLNPYCFLDTLCNGPAPVRRSDQSDQHGRLTGVSAERFELGVFSGVDLITYHGNGLMARVDFATVAASAFARRDGGVAAGRRCRVREPCWSSRRSYRSRSRRRRCPGGRCRWRRILGRRRARPAGRRLGRRRWGRGSKRSGRCRHPC